MLTLELISSLESKVQNTITEINRLRKENISINQTLGEFKELSGKAENELIEAKKLISNLQEKNLQLENKILSFNNDQKEIEEVIGRTLANLDIIEDQLLKEGIKEEKTTAALTKDNQEKEIDIISTPINDHISDAKEESEQHINTKVSEATLTDSREKDLDNSSELDIF